MTLKALFDFALIVALIQNYIVFLRIFNGAPFCRHAFPTKVGGLRKLRERRNIIIQYRLGRKLSVARFLRCDYLYGVNSALRFKSVHLILEIHGCFRSIYAEK